MVRASVLTDKYVQSMNTKKVPKDISPVSDGSKGDAAPVQATFSSNVLKHTPLKSALKKTDCLNVEVSREIGKSASNLQDIDPREGASTRPYIKLGMNKTTKDVVAISQIPETMGEDALVKLISSFGSVETFNWNKIDPTVCQVVYEEPGVARAAVRSLRRTASNLNVHLRTHNSSVQLFVGDLLPSISEKMLEVTFSRMVGSKVTASLKRDPKTHSPIGYGFLTFKSENDAIKALIEGNRLKIGDAIIRIGRAERNCYLYVDNIPENTTIEELKASFAEFGELVDEDCELVRRADATVKVANGAVAMFSKMVLENSSAKMENVTVSFGNKENDSTYPSEVRLAVMFKKTGTKPPSALKDLILTTFSKYGHCAVKIPVTRYGKWKHHAIVTFLGDYKSAQLAAITAMQNVHHVSQVGVQINWAREILPRIPTNVPARTFHKNGQGHTHRSGYRNKSRNNRNGINHINSNMDATFRARMLAKEFVPRKMEFKTPPKDSGDENTPPTTMDVANNAERADLQVAGASNEGNVAEQIGSDSPRFIYSPLPAEAEQVLYPASVISTQPPIIGDATIHQHGNTQPIMPFSHPNSGAAVEGESVTKVANIGHAFPAAPLGTVGAQVYADGYPLHTLPFAYGYMGVQLARHVVHHVANNQNVPGSSNATPSGLDTNCDGN